MIYSVATQAMGTARATGERSGMHGGFADIRCAPLELALMTGGTDVGVDLDDPRSLPVSLALPQSEGNLGKGFVSLACWDAEGCCSLW